MAAVRVHSSPDAVVLVLIIVDKAARSHPARLPPQ
jgi:hypothetical protein